jgi:hypothetical protein
MRIRLMEWNGRAWGKQGKAHTRAGWSKKGMPLGPTLGAHSIKPCESDCALPLWALHFNVSLIVLCPCGPLVLD